MLSEGVGTQTASTGAATLDKQLGVITTEALTTAQDAAYTLTLTNAFVAAGSVVLVSVANGTNTQGTAILVSVKPAAGSVVIVVKNKHASAEALNGTLKIAFLVL
jgi:Na+-transporting NADH:ubiquinone oxidoreductase subunit NqrD